MTTVFMVFCVLIKLHLLVQGPCQESFFEMSLKRDSVYTPGRMQMFMRISDKAILEGPYAFRISVVLEGSVIRKQVLPAVQDKTTVFVLDFPETRGRAAVRCRAELLVDGEFVEAKEVALAIWPPLKPAPKQPRDKVIWVFDTSGALKKICDELGVRATDATFQAVRDFQRPNIVLVGENIDHRSFNILEDRISADDAALETIVFLRQEVLPNEWAVQVADGDELPATVRCDPNCLLLSGLSKLDIMKLTIGATPVQVPSTQDKSRTIASYVSAAGRDQDTILSYLGSLRTGKVVTVYCQLPITASLADEPRAGALFRNLLQFVYEHGISLDNRRNISDER
jgi:hypothetical protein